MKTLSMVLAAMLFVVAAGIAQASNHDSAPDKLIDDNSSATQVKK